MKKRLWKKRWRREFNKNIQHLNAVVKTLYPPEVIEAMMSRAK